MSIDELISVLQEAKKGKKIQGKCVDKWEDFTDAELKEYVDNCEIRVAPEPREKWHAILENGQVADCGADTLAKAKINWPWLREFVRFREVLEDE